jgi:hypothetical protein
MPDRPPLEARVALLEAALAQLASQLVTRRVEIVDERGVARVVLSAALGTGSVLARIDRPTGEARGIELFAAEVEGEPPSVGICELVGGEVLPVVESIDDLGEGEAGAEGDAP